MNKGTQNENSDTLFFEALMNNIMEGVKTPKVQIERVVGPILGFFIKDIISSLLNYEDLIILGAEFPLRKLDNNQSTNIDWLMYSKTDNKLLFVELKTTVTSLSTAQALSYDEIQAKIRKGTTGAEFLKLDVSKIMGASKEKEKYTSVWNKIKDINFSVIDNSQIIYIAPKAAKNRFSKIPCRDAVFYSFADLAIDEGKNIPFRSQWEILQKILCELDGKS